MPHGDPSAGHKKCPNNKLLPVGQEKNACYTSNHPSYAVAPPRECDGKSRVRFVAHDAQRTS